MIICQNVFIITFHSSSPSNEHALVLPPSSMRGSEVLSWRNDVWFGFGRHLARWWWRLLEYYEVKKTSRASSAQRIHRDKPQSLSWFLMAMKISANFFQIIKRHGRMKSVEIYISLPSRVKSFSKQLLHDKWRWSFKWPIKNCCGNFLFYKWKKENFTTQKLSI